MSAESGSSNCVMQLAVTAARQLATSPLGLRMVEEVVCDMLEGQLQNAWSAHFTKHVKAYAVQR